MKQFLYLSQFQKHYGRQQKDDLSMEADVKIYGFSPLNKTEKETIS